MMVARTASMPVMRCLAVLLTALALVPGGAHALTLPNKIGLPQNDYFVAQGLYSGWALLGGVLVAALLADLGLAILERHRLWSCFLASTAALCLALGLAIFFLWTYPANQATANWTMAPADWQALRRQWEYSHAANAGLSLAALCCIVLATLGRRPVTPNAN